MTTVDSRFPMMHSLRTSVGWLFASARPRARLYTGCALSGLATLLAVAYTRHVGTPIFSVDDAYISLHNAEVLLAGSDAIVLGDWDATFHITDSLRARGWQLEPRYAHAYVVYEVTGRP